MSFSDPIADLLTRIRNAHLAKHDRLDVPSSRLKLEICRILQQQGYIDGYETVGGRAAHDQQIRVLLRYADDGTPAIRRIARVSKPGRRVYRGSADIRPVLNGLGLGIVSTSLGLLTDAEAREKRVGGEILCEVW